MAIRSFGPKTVGVLIRLHWVPVKGGLVTTYGAKKSGNVKALRFFGELKFAVWTILGHAF